MRSSNARLSVTVNVPGARQNAFSLGRPRNVVSWKRRSLGCCTLLTTPPSTSLLPARSLCPLSRPRPLPLLNVRTVLRLGGLPLRTASHRQRSHSPPHNRSSKRPRRKKDATRKRRRKPTRTRGAPENGPAHQRTSTVTPLSSALLRPRDPLQCTRQLRHQLRRPPE